MSSLRPEVGNEAVVSGLVNRQRAFYQSGETRPYAFRRAMLEKLRTAVRKNGAAFDEALASDLNKHPLEGYMCETGLVLEEIAYHCGHLRAWMREKRMKTPLSQFHARSFVSPEPYGVTLIMSPWNYPVQLCLMPLIGAISGGNCAIVKPSAYAPATSRVIARILRETFPQEYIAVVEGGREENQALLKQRFDYIFFTGSVAVGKIVMEAAARDLTPVTLELGGKSPVIIDRTANMKRTARRVLFGKLINSGQTCVAPDYALVEAAARDELIEEMRKVLQEFFPNGDRSEMARIVDEKHYIEKKKLLEGQTAAIGGGYCDRTHSIDPTVLIDVEENSPIMREEIFAPILPVLTWEKLDEAIAFVQAREKPLALYLFTSDKAVKRQVLDQCAFGGGCVNDTLMHAATSEMGFGGVGYSGMGQYHGRRSFETFTHARSVIDKSTWIDLSVRYFPYAKQKLSLIKKMLK